MGSDRPGTSESCWPGFKPARGRERLRKSKLNSASKTYQHVPWSVSSCTYLCVVVKLRLGDVAAGVTSVQFFFFLFFFTLDAGLLARSQYSKVPATGHIDTGFTWFPCVYKQMLRWFPTFQVATTCF